MAFLSLELCVDAQPCLDALKLLAEFGKRSPEVVDRFLDGLDATAQLVRIDCDRIPAAGTSKRWIAFQPSDLLVEFLAASRTGERDGV